MSRARWVATSSGVGSAIGCPSSMLPRCLTVYGSGYTFIIEILHGKGKYSMHSSDIAKRWLGLVAIALGVALIVVDTTVVNVIVPSIVRDLGVTSVQAQWIQESYAIVFAALLLVVGRVADIWGARRVFLTGVVLFGATSLLAGLAPNGEMLVLARFLQGAGAALILPTS